MRPDLVVEISSPRTESLNRGYKKALYARYCVKEYWVVSPQTRNIEVYGISSGGLIPLGEYKLGERLPSRLLPGFPPALDEEIRINHLNEEGESEMNITTIGLDIAKNVFQAHGVDGSGRW